MNATERLKKETRAALNAARAAAGLPPKAPRLVRKLAHDDPLVLELKKRAGLDFKTRAERR